jgi:drug/metabolite transporter (DMT)-like permease
VAIVLALASAIMYGTSDYLGGRASRRVAPVALALFAEAVILPLCLVVIPLIEDDAAPRSAVVWGLLAGFMGSVAVIGLYVALARGNMTVVAPITGVVSAVVPVIVGIATGERPGAVALGGIVVAMVAVALVGGLARAFGGRVSHPVISPGTLALAVAVGVGFGLLFVAFSRTGEDSGLWSLLFARFTGLPVLMLAYVLYRRGAFNRAGEAMPAVPIDRALVLPGLTVGTLVVLGNGTYVLSTREDLLSVVAVVVSMYPAATVGWAALLDGERAARSQVVGMVLAAGALAMITLG